MTLIPSHIGYANASLTIQCITHQDFLFLKCSYLGFVIGAQLSHMPCAFSVSKRNPGETTGEHSSNPTRGEALPFMFWESWDFRFHINCDFTQFYTVFLYFILFRALYMHELTVSLCLGSVICNMTPVSILVFM